MFEKLIIKFISRTANLEELCLLMKYLEVKKNVEVFKSFIKINYFSIYTMQNIDRKEILEIVQKRISSEQKRKRREKNYLKVLRYAAILTIFFGLGYYYNTFQSQTNTTQIITPNEDSIVLTTSDGTKIILNEDQKDVEIESQLSLNKNSSQLNYNKTFKGNDVIKKPVFHMLEVPFGKRFKIVLSDGTLVHLNSGSKLKYPVKFDKNKPRTVSLEGEAFFNVAERKNQIFSVNTETINVEVYGTKFNFKNHPEDNYSDVVLVEGSVGLYSKYIDNIIRLKPGIKGSFNKSNLSITQDKINTSIYTSWIDGQVVFRNESFESILIKLERIYNVEIINNSNNKPNETFNAKIDVEKESINDVLSYFNKIYNIKYQTFNNKIIIN
jgi:ferric-dicitrate binding protein FerR (iron transport regulator)